MEPAFEIISAKNDSVSARILRGIQNGGGFFSPWTGGGTGPESSGTVRFGGEEYQILLRLVNRKADITRGLFLKDVEITSDWAFRLEDGCRSRTVCTVLVNTPVISGVQYVGRIKIEEDILRFAVTGEGIPVRRSRAAGRGAW